MAAISQPARPSSHDQRGSHLTASAADVPDQRGRRYGASAAVLSRPMGKNFSHDQFGRQELAFWSQTWVNIYVERTISLQG